jgi:spore germination cell wall hydrolase CwlJ-like protein
VRIFSLSVALALVLSATLVPVSDVVVRVGPQCLPSVDWQRRGTGPFPFSRGDSTALSSYNLEDRDYLIRTIAFEAAHEPALGKAAVAHVILNRKKSGGWGRTVKEIVTQPWQFEPWMTRRNEIEQLVPDDLRYKKAARIADAVLEGDMPDPTAGATHFLNATVVRQRRAGSLPSWARGEGLAIGRHTFYAPDTGSGVQQASFPLTAITRAMFIELAYLSC